MALSRNFIEDLSARCNIVEIVSKYVKLTKKGSCYFGLCPFHNEKTPSFSVSYEKNMFHCFGCNAGGSVITFIMMIECFSYIDAVKYLADMYNITLLDGEYDNRTAIRTKKILEINKIIARHYYENLHNEKGKKALEYLTKRGLKKRVMDNFGLGFSYESWDDALVFLKSKGYFIEDIYNAGIIMKGRNDNYYDRFRNRIMFPIINVRSEVIGFGGRVLDDSLPKYLNSPENLVFTKGKNLFAMNLARKTKRNELILAEGYMDVISLHQSGFDNAVASLGTALTDKQAKAISDQKKNLIIAYDSDDAGQAAVNRAIDVLKRTDVDVKIIKFQEAKDPDEFIKNYGVSALENLLGSSQNQMDYKIMNLRSKYDLENDEQRVAFLNEGVKIVSSIDNAVSREVYAGRIASLCGVTREAVIIEVKKLFTQRVNLKKAQEKRRALSPVNMAQPDLNKFRYDNIKSAKAEEGIIALIFSDYLLIDFVEENLQNTRFSSEILGKIYEYAKQNYKSVKSLNLGFFDEVLTSDEMSLLSAILTKPVPNTLKHQAVLDYINTIKLSSNIADEENFEEIYKMQRQKKGYGGL